MYVGSTVAMFIPWNNPLLTQYLIAWWQFCPLVVNASVWILALTVFANSASKGAAKSTAMRRPDLKILDEIYAVSATVAAVGHVYTVYGSFVSTDPHGAWQYVFLPIQDTSKGVVAEVLHYIFLWDFWLIFGSSLLACCLVVSDTQAQLRCVNLCGLFALLFAMPAASVVVGPGAVVAVVWRWREHRLVDLEEQSIDDKKFQ